MDIPDRYCSDPGVMYICPPSSHSDKKCRCKIANMWHHMPTKVMFTTVLSIVHDNITD